MATDHTPVSEMTPGELRKFGLVTGALIILLIGGLLPWIWHKSILEWQKVTGPIGGTLIVWALLHAKSLIYVYKPWMAIAEKIGWFNTRVILLLLFYVVIFPIGFVMRLFGHDPMMRKFDDALGSYRKEKEPQEKSHMETPY
ncbi:MAG: hypothetical protein KDI30_13305 [Pseudomonadales bacterium]|nr:hypothetical protein [Pseudomonadales bacterium]